MWLKSGTLLGEHLRTFHCVRRQTI